MIHVSMRCRRITWIVFQSDCVFTHSRLICYKRLSPTGCSPLNSRRRVRSFYEESMSWLFNLAAAVNWCLETVQSSTQDHRICMFKKKSFVISNTFSINKGWSDWTVKKTQKAEHWLEKDSFLGVFNGGLFNALDLRNRKAGYFT